MSDSDYDPYWWKDAKAESLERKQSAPLPGAGDKFLVVTEGTVTEPVYFNLLIAELELNTVTVKLIPGAHSDPRHVIKTAVKEAKALQNRAKNPEKLGNNELPKYDQVWAVIDTDVAIEEGFWNEVIDLARGNKVNLADSSPCFELWLLLHFKYSTASIQDGDTAKSLVKREFGKPYSTNRAEAETALPEMVPKWPEAVVRAERMRQHHEVAATTLPANPSTNVAILIRALNNAAPKHKQRLSHP